MATYSSNQYTSGLLSTANASNPATFAHYYPVSRIEMPIQSSAILADPYTGNQLQVGHSAEYSFWQSYARQAAVHPDVAASIAYTLPQYPVYTVGSPHDDPYGMPHGINGMLNVAGQMYPAMPTYRQPTSMEGSALMAAETCVPSDTRNYKKVQCRHFAAGMCVRGATCGFKHGDDDNGDSLRAMVLPAMMPMMSHLNAGKPFRVVPCQHWLTGNCKKGAFCTFRHEFPAVNPTVSKHNQYLPSSDSSSIAPPSQ
jgi:hypothetical protein